MLCRQNLIAAWITFRVNVSLSHLSATFMNHSGVGERGSGWMVSVQRAADFFCIFCQPDINLTTTSQQVYNLFCVILLHHLPKWKCSSWWTVKQNAVIISKDVHEVLQEPKILEVWLKETSCPPSQKGYIHYFPTGNHGHRLVRVDPMCCRSQSDETNNNMSYKSTNSKSLFLTFTCFMWNSITLFLFVFLYFE